MKSVEFEEKEYEAFLYTQLERGTLQLWSPGQVLEHYLGIDRGLLTVCEYLWQLKGHSQPLRGFAPYYFADLWHHLPRRRSARGRLPRFRLNCFVQAKRPSYGVRLPPRLTKLGVAPVFYRFDVDQHQQSCIERVAQRLANRALFVYAAAVYHTTRDLFRHSGRGTTVEHSTFPDIVAMTGHKAWYYNSPGGSGVRNQGFEPYESASLEQRLQALRAELTVTGQEGTQSAELAALSTAIAAAVIESDEVAGTARADAMSDEWRNIDSFVDNTGAQPAARDFLHVVAFTVYFNLFWLTAAEEV
ncbi:MAG TPA: hypothetical protein VJB15_07060 [Rhodothermia bacterium]|nr:hypothetical protein [Rhodothermia bacterium]